MANQSASAGKEVTDRSLINTRQSQYDGIGISWYIVRNFSISAGKFDFCRTFK